MLIDSSPLLLFFAMIVSLLALAAFDFYAYSPKPSGVAMRSRELAPGLIIFFSLCAAILGLALHTPVDFEQLILSGANYAPRTVGSDRMRLLSYVFVTTNIYESVLLALSLLTSAVFLGRFRMLGWSLVVLGTIAGTGLTAALVDPVGLTYGPFEVCVGLFGCSLLCFYWESGRDFTRARISKILMPASVLLVAAIGILILGFLKTSAFRPELIAAPLLISTMIAAAFAKIQRMSGPHWEATSLFFVTAIGGAVSIGFAAYVAPQGFDLPKWRKEGVTIRLQIREDLQSAMAPLEKPNEAQEPTVESELNFASELQIAGRRLQHFIMTGENGKVVENDKKVIEELKLVGRMIGVLERLHRSRAAVEDAERRTRAAVFQSDAFTQADALYTFWQRDRPWMDAELVAFRGQPAMQSFVQALNSDLDRLTQAALDVEVRRVDAWVDWATRQPSSRLPSMKIVAFEQAARLETLSTNAKSMRLQPDPRIYTLHRNLRRMASVSSTGKWE